MTSWRRTTTPPQVSDAVTITEAATDNPSPRAGLTQAREMDRPFGANSKDADLLIASFNEYTKVGPTRSSGWSQLDITATFVLADWLNTSDGTNNNKAARYLNCDSISR
jgi:hypothetical protein